MPTIPSDRLRRIPFFIREIRVIPGWKSLLPATKRLSYLMFDFA